MVKIRDLQYLDAIAKYRHFGKAAQACFVSQPTLSGQLMKLEQQLGLTLIERKTKSVTLTSHGQLLIDEAKAVLKAAKSFEASARALLDPLAGEMHVGLIPTLAPYLLPHIMTKLSKRLPMVKFYLYEDKTENLIQQLDEGDLDCLILPWLDTMDKFERYDLFNEPFVLACDNSHPFATKKTIKLEALHNEKILTLQDGHCLRDQAMGYCFSAGATEDDSFRATSLETLRYMVAAKMGITLLPQLAALNNTSSNNLTYVNFAPDKPNRQISLVIRNGYSRMVCIREVVSSIKHSMNEII